MSRVFLKTVFNYVGGALAVTALLVGPARADQHEADSAPATQPVESDAPAADAEAPAVESEAPAADEAAPAVDEAAPAVDEAAPAADEGPEIELPEADAVSAAPAYSSAMRGNPVMIGGYGELHYSREMPEGDGDSESEIDFHRMVVYVGKQWSPELRFYSELEIEHGIVGDGKPGEVAIEQAFVEYRLANGDDALGEFGVRAGIVLIPMGIINQWHEPPIFHGVERPRVENRIIPTTWREGGVGIYGKPGAVPGLSYELYVVGGLNPLAFSASSGIRGGRQKVGEANADGLALTGRVQYQLGTSTVLGGAGYFGMAGPNARVGDDLDVPVAGFAADVRTKLRGIEAKALVAMFSIGDTDELDALTDADGNDIGPAVGDKLFGAYGEIAYDVLDSHPTAQQLLPFFRYEYYDTDPDDDTRSVSDLVFGLSYRPIQQVVFKADFTLRRPGGDADGANILDLGVGFLY